MLDPAFVDRADIKEFVGNPPPQAIYWILASCIRELVDRGLIRKVKLLEWRDIDKRKNDRDIINIDNFKGVLDKSAEGTEISIRLAELAKRSSVSLGIHDLHPMRLAFNFYCDRGELVTDEEPGLWAFRAISPSRTNVRSFEVFVEK